MADEMTTITEILPATGEIREREISKEDYEELFSGMKVTTIGPSEEGTFTHTINPGGSPIAAQPPAITPAEFARLYQEQLRMITPAEYQQRFHGMQNWEPVGVPYGGFLESLPEPEPDPEPSVWERIKSWLGDLNTQTVEVTRTQRQHYDPSYMERYYPSAYCTPFDQFGLTGRLGRLRTPHRGGRQSGRHVAGLTMAAVLHEDYNRMIREGSGIPAPEMSREAGLQRAGLRSEVGQLTGVRIVRSRPSSDEAEARWLQATKVGAL